MAHRAGLPAVREKITLSDVLDWSRMIELLAAERPFWPPGSKHGYHAVTLGFLAGELVRRVDPLHRSFGTFVREELSIPLDSELYIGIPTNDIDIHQRIAPLVRKSSVNFEEILPDMDEVTELTNTCSGAFPIDFHGPNIFNDTTVHQAELPAANLITNARSLARLYAALIGDIDDGRIKALIDENTRQRAITCATPNNEPDSTLFGLPTRFAMGFQTYGHFLNVLGDGVFGHNGKI
jgi:CubicO group peptidase (beta-lactamase class C family)